MQYDGAWFDGSAQFRFFPDCHVHDLRCQNTKFAREFQRSQIHWFRNVHDVCHLVGFRADLFRQRVENHHALHLRLAQRHGYTGAALRTQVVHYTVQTGKE